MPSSSIGLLCKFIEFLYKAFLQSCLCASCYASKLKCVVSYTVVTGYHVIVVLDYEVIVVTDHEFIASMKLLL